MSTHTRRRCFFGHRHRRPGRRRRCNRRYNLAMARRGIGIWIEEAISVRFAEQLGAEGVP